MSRFPRLGCSSSFVLSATTLAMSCFSIGVSAQAQRQSLPKSFAAPAKAQPAASLPTSQRLGLTISLPLRNPDQLKIFLQQLRDPSSPQYGKFLTVQQFTDRFGPSEADYAKVVAYAKASGMTVTRTHTNRLLVNVSATVSAINNTFAVTMKQYKHPTENRMFFAPDVEPTIAGKLPILSVQGFSDYDRPHSMLRKASSQAAHSDTTGSGPGGDFLGSDMRAAYAPGVSLDGSGQSVALVELGPYNLSDVQSYFSSINQPLNVPIYNVLLGVDGICSGTPNSGGCDDGEEVIDMEQAISMAPHLSALIIYETNGPNTDAETAFSQAAEDNVAKQISFSFGFGGTPATDPGYEQVFEELQAQGQNVFVSSGDSGASVGTVGYPGNSPNIVAVGGTDLTTSGPGGSWVSESGWVGSGGGWNTQSPIPGYQTAAINATNQGSTSYRNIPDVSMEANTDNYFCANGSCTDGIGGTSLSAPRWAGFLAMANEQANGHPVGFLNPTVYSLGKTANYASLFHDITTGNDFNSSSPNLFSAVSGYDLVTGWGTPDGQAALNSIGPVSTTSPNFSLSASPASIPLTPGESGQTVIDVAPANGFAGTVNLVVTVIGAPAGVTATLDESSVKGGSGSAVLNVSTTSDTPGGNLLIAVTGTSEGISQTAYISLALPDFGLSVSPSAIYLNQNSFASATITAAPENGFDGNIKFSLTSGTPAGVLSTTLPGATANTSLLAYLADSAALTGANSPVAITGQSGSVVQNFSSASLAVSAATGNWGGGTPVDLSSAFNIDAFFSDGTNFSKQGGLGGYAYSATLLTPARVLNGVQFNFGKANGANAVSAAGQTIALPEGRYTTLQLMASAINGNQTAQTLTVTYTDGTTSHFTQSFSDWFSPSSNLGEAEAVAMPYRDIDSGKQDPRPFNLYGYAFLLNGNKQVKSLTLPNDANVLVLAANLVSPYLGTQVNLASAFNATGIYTDGTAFSESGGLDGGGAAYSANLLGDESSARGVIVNGIRYNLAAANHANVAYGKGSAVLLPAGRYIQMRILGTGIQGAQTAQSVVVTYTDGTSEKKPLSHAFTQSFSDWFSPSAFPNESEVFAMPYRDLNDGTQDDRTFNLYQYILPLDISKTVKSVVLPEDRNVVTLAITMVGSQQLLPPAGSKP